MRSHGERECEHSDAQMRARRLVSPCRRTGITKGCICDSVLAALGGPARGDKDGSRAANSQPGFMHIAEWTPRTSALPILLEPMKLTACATLGRRGSHRGELDGQRMIMVFDFIPTAVSALAASCSAGRRCLPLRRLVGRAWLCGDEDMPVPTTNCANHPGPVFKRQHDMAVRQRTFTSSSQGEA